MEIILDISEFQQPSAINYDLLAKQVDLVIIRTQYGSNHIDNAYKTHHQEFKKRGVPTAAYAWVRGVNIADMQIEATDFYNRTKEFLPTFWFLDVEEQSMSDMRNGVSAYVHKLRELGAQKVGIYVANHLYAQFNLNIAEVDASWIPSYGVNNGQVSRNPDHPCDLHQYTSVGRLNGYNGNLDLSRIIGSKPLEFFTGNTQSTNNLTPSNVNISSTPIQHVKALVVTDIRNTPSHSSGFIRNTTVGEVFPVYAHQGDWHYIGWNPKDGDCWIDGNGGNNLFWVDNPNLKQPTAPQEQYYVIQPGDTLSRIAARFGTSISQLQSWNGIKNPNMISAGVKIRVK